MIMDAAIVARDVDGSWAPLVLGLRHGGVESGGDSAAVSV